MFPCDSPESPTRIGFLGEEQYGTVAVSSIMHQKEGTVPGP
jgi:hypothetical protein